MNLEPTPNPHSIPSLLRELRDETVNLFRQEVSLAKAEIKENVSRLESHVAQVAVGAFLAYAGLIVFCIGLGYLLSAVLVRAGLDEPVARWLGPSIIGVIVAIIGWAMLAKARRNISQDDIVPQKTVETLRDDKQWSQSKLPHSS